MKELHTRDFKSLANTIRSVVDPIDQDKDRQLQEGFINSLTERARQVVSESQYENEEKEEEEEEDDSEEMMKRLAAKALKRAKKKARRNPPRGDDAYAGKNPSAEKYDADMLNPGAVAEEYPHKELQEKAAPGYEDWASDPKVKASFKKQYGKKWKQVMYGRSWNMAKMDEEAELAEGSYVHSKGELKKAIKGSKKEIGKAYKKGDRKSMKFWMQNKKDAEEQLGEGLSEGVRAKRMRIFRKAARKAARTGQPLPRDPDIADFMARSFKKQMYKDRSMFGGAEAAVRGRAERRQAAMKARGLAEAEQLDEAITARVGRENKRRDKTGMRPDSGLQRRLHARKIRVANKYGINPKNRDGIDAVSRGLRNTAMKAKGLDPMGAMYESEQLDEGKGGRSKFTNLMKRQVSRVRRAGGREDVQREIGNYTEREAAGGESKMSYQARRAFSDANIEARIKERDAKKAKKAKARAAMKEQVLAEAGYKKLMRLKKAAYNKSLKARTGDPAAQDKFAKTKRAEAEQESKVATRMAMKGGASADAVRGGGNRRGKRGGFTAQAGKLANKREEGIRNFRNLNVDRGVARDTEIGTVQAITNRVTGKKPQMTPAQVARKRESQAKMREFGAKVRSGTFGTPEDPKAAEFRMRPRYNYLKRTGQLKTK